MASPGDINLNVQNNP